jgi:hypothetical protein
MSSYFDTSGDKTLGDPELRKCPHCGSQMLKWYTPPALTWGTPYQYVCFNDECGYYVRGWKWLEQQYNKKASYRHRFNPFTGETGPVPVWSPAALRGRIMNDDETVDQFVRRTGGGEE